MVKANLKVKRKKGNKGKGGRVGVWGGMVDGYGSWGGLKSTSDLAPVQQAVFPSLGCSDLGKRYYSNYVFASPIGPGFVFNY